MDQLIKAACVIYSHNPSLSNHFLYQHLHYKVVNECVRELIIFKYYLNGRCGHIHHGVCITSV